MALQNHPLINGSDGIPADLTDRYRCDCKCTEFVAKREIIHPPAFQCLFWLDHSGDNCKRCRAAGKFRLEWLRNSRINLDNYYPGDWHSDRHGNIVAV